MNQEMIFGTVGGLGLFLFGMRIMSDGLQKSAGQKMRQLLQMLTSNRIIALLVGLTVTAVIQSSSATTVMVVSFVNAGLMSLTQAIGVVLGANIGTTITAQMIAFKIHAYALPCIGVGMAMKLFAKKDKWINIGEIILGFGILFFGMSVMKDAFGPLKSNPMFADWFVQFSTNPLLAVAVATIFTMIVQSSSATVVIVMALASTGLLDFTACVALILGDNIGTTITAQLASIGTNITAKRAARAHMLFNVMGVIVILLILPYFAAMVDRITPGDSEFVIATAADAARYGMEIGEKPFISRHIANAHTIFNVVNCLLFLPLLGLLARLATLMVPAKEEEAGIEFHLKYLAPGVMDTPEIGLTQARMEIARMADVTDKMLKRGLQYLTTGDEALYNRVTKKEQLVDMLQKEVTDFLTELSQRAVSAETSKQMADMLHMTADLERIGDHAENIAKLAFRMHKNKVNFSDSANKELGEITRHARDFVSLISAGLQEHDPEMLAKARTMEEKINQFEDALRAHHVQRLQDGKCIVESGLIYIDLLTNLEKIGDHAFNVAQFLAGAR